MKQILSLLLLALTPLVAFSQSVKLPETVKGGVGTFIEVPADTKEAFVSWLAIDPGLNLFPTRLLKDTKTAVVTASAPGRYRLSCVTALGDKPSEFATTTVIVGDVPPGPGPTPPGPNPPDPKPPGPVPIPEVGFRTLIVFDKNKVDLPPPQVDILRGKEVRDYLNIKAAKGTNGIPEWAIWPDADNVESYPSVPLKNAYKRARASVPWIVISNGTNGYEGPLPSTVADTMTLLKKFGG